MANKKYNEFVLGSFDAAKIFLIADPETGSLVKIALEQIPTIYTQDGTLLNNRSIGLGGNFLHVTGLNNIPILELGDGHVKVSASNATGGGSAATFEGSADENSAQAVFLADFNGSVASILASVNASSSQIGMAAGKFVLQVNDEIYLELEGDDFESRIRASDGNAVSQLRLFGTVAGNDCRFFLEADDGDQDVVIEGDAQAQTITHTAGTHVFNGIVTMTSQLTFSDSEAQSSIKMYSPDNTLWNLVITDAGVLDIQED